MADPGRIDQKPAEWDLEDAKAHFGELIREARRGVPQRVSAPGAEDVVVLSIEDYKLLSSDNKPNSFVAFMESLSLLEINLARDDNGQTVEL